MIACTCRCVSVSTCVLICLGALGVLCNGLSLCDLVICEMGAGCQGLGYMLSVETWLCVCITVSSLCEKLCDNQCLHVALGCVSV